jgi:hypothetical protein
MAKTPAFTNKDVLKPVRAKHVLEIQQIDLTKMPDLEKGGLKFQPEHVLEILQIDLTKMPDLEKGGLKFQYVMSVLDVFSRSSPVDTFQFSTITFINHYNL